MRTILWCILFATGVSSFGQENSCQVQTRKNIQSYAGKSVFDLLKTMSIRADYSKKIKECYQPKTRITTGFKQSLNLGHSITELLRLKSNILGQIPEAHMPKIEFAKNILMTQRDFLDSRNGKVQLTKSESALISKLEQKNNKKISALTSLVFKMKNYCDQNSKVNESDLANLQQQIDALNSSISSEIDSFLKVQVGNARSKNLFKVNCMNLLTRENNSGASLDKLGISIALHDKDFAQSAGKVENFTQSISPDNRHEQVKLEEGSISEIVKAVESGDFDQALRRTDGFSRKHVFVPDKIGKVSLKLDQMTYQKSSQEYLNGMVAGQNEGLINYISNNLIPSNPRLIETTWKLIDKIDRDPHGDNYQAALSASGNDPIVALETLSIFGHDDCCNSLTPSDSIRSDLTRAEQYLNLKKNSSSVDYLYQPGSVKGLQVDPSIQAQFTTIEREWESLAKKHKGDPHYTLEKGAFRPGYYHFYGGMFMATELIKEGLGKIGPFELPEFIAQKSAAAYKLMSIDAYLTGDAMKDERYLYRLGYGPNKKIPAPSGWDPDRFKLAKLVLDLNYLHVNLAEDQHAAGARFAVEKIRAWATQKDCKDLNLNR